MRLAVGLGGFCFFLGLFLLFFFFVFVADDFKNGYFGVVADTVAGVNDARIASGAIAKLRSDLAEQLLRNGWHQQVAGGLAARLQRVALAERDHFLRYG